MIILASSNINYALISFNNTLSRLSGTPLDSTEIWSSLSKLKNYAKSDRSYVGQTVKVINNVNKTVDSYIIEDTEGNIKKLPNGEETILVIDNTALMLNLSSINNGQVVFNRATRTFFILKDDNNINNINSWSEQSIGEQFWLNNSNDKVNFYSLSYKDYLNLKEIDEGTIYFIIDKGLIYKGNTNVTINFESIKSFENFDINNAIDYRLYICFKTFECRIKVNNEWLILSPGYITDGSNYADLSNGTKLATVNVIKKIIEDSINTEIINKIDKMENGEEDMIVLSTKDGNVKRSEKKIGESIFQNSENNKYLATEEGVLNKFSWKDF